MLAHVDHFLSKPLWLCSIPGVLIQLLVLILTTRCSTFFVYSKPTLTPTVPHVQTDTPLPFNLTPLSPLGVSPEPFSQTHLHSNPIRQRKVLPLSQSHHLSPPHPSVCPLPTHCQGQSIWCYLCSASHSYSTRLHCSHKRVSNYGIRPRVGATERYRQFADVTVLLMSLF